MNNSLIHWLVSSYGSLYTNPREFSIELLPNGLFRLFHYGPGLSSVLTSLEAAQAEAEATLIRMEGR